MVSGAVYCVPRQLVARNYCSQVPGSIGFRLVDTFCFGVKPKTYHFWTDKTAPETDGFRPAYSLTDTNNFGNVFGSPKTTLFPECGLKCPRNF
jgi:hypothetical protein